jgi:hypothetical protein
MLPLTTHGAWLLLANALIPIACIVFACGFFPYKPFIPGLAEYRQLEYGEPPEAQFDKLIFMVVDALRRHALISQDDHNLLLLIYYTATLFTPTAQDSHSLRGNRLRLIMMC